jgi:2-polyprenyl-3-methyl-5-hydroxy-6-metoxy-1,4-benzoquinol methylase
MDLSTAARLIELNRDFYDRFGDHFSATRQRIQPGVRRIVDLLKGDESILDLGCGNGGLARTLAKCGHSGSYLGVDFSLPLLQAAESLPESFPARFVQADLTELSRFMDQLSSAGGWSVVTSFAVLHHIPSSELRLNLLRIVRQLVRDDGLFIHSTWQFLNSEQLKASIQPWEAAAVPASAVDACDYLLDWRSGGNGLRYVHHFDEKELDGLAGASGFRVSAMFHADGAGGRLGLYEIWRPVW